MSPEIWGEGGGIGKWKKRRRKKIEAYEVVGKDVDTWERLGKERNVN